ncbi:J domain-containing protein [Natrinema ejinorense]|uniref:Molecular chaperone DnaJ n=1 Tax=Natrinema ejinorense TaxID=373386 RepID=A0A2A5QTH5_9EURY|nr:J domain-containing protein [Natrinema ejinorense]PCR90131.1 molecular chaperone DnaJ [Natrinema ejinorense]
MGETYYDVLEVDPDATQEEIESAYRDRVLETHPDHSDDPDAAEQFQRVTTAKSVLTDGTERARYDRLGHEAYVGLAQATHDSSDGSEESRSRESDTDRTDTTQRSTGSGRTATGRQGSSAGTGRTATDAGTTSNGRQRRSTGTDAGAGGETETTETTSGRTETNEETERGSHHARQRSKRRRRRAKRHAATGGPFVGDDGSDLGTPGTGTTTTVGESTDSQDEEAEYSVHDWNDEIDLERNGHPFDRTTVVSVGAVALLYPLFVAASLTTMFSLPVNAIIAACTLALVGYLLTMPRVAIATFGVWSVLFPVGMLQTGLADPFTLVGLLTLAFAWVPLGNAVALWWVLRP